MRSAIALPVGFSITVPESWTEVELRPAARAASAKQLAYARTREVPELRPHRGTIAKLLLAVATQAWDSGAAYCAVMAEPTADGVLTGSVTVSVVRAPVGAEDDPAALLEPLRNEHPAGEERWREVGVVDLPAAGPAARTWGVEDVALEPGGATAPTVVMQTFVPAPEAGSVVVVSCASPAVAIAPVLHDLFDAVSGTLRLAPSAARPTAGHDVPGRSRAVGRHA